MNVRKATVVVIGIVALLVGAGWADGAIPVGVRLPGQPLGDGWAQFDLGGFFHTYILQHSGGPPQVDVVFDDGTAMAFEMTLDPGSQQIQPIQFTTGGFRALAGVVGTLSPVDSEIFVESQIGPTVLYSLSTFDLYNPQQFSYVSGGQSYRLNAVPEPAGIVVVGAALVWMGMRRRIGR